MDATTSGGKPTFHIFAALAEFERTLTRERTKGGCRRREAEAATVKQAI